MAISETNYGLIRKATGVAAFESIPVPTLPDDYLLIRVVTVAVNPTDWTTLDAPGDDGTLVGCDWAGTVEEIGPNVKREFKKGDRVAGFAHGGKSNSCQAPDTSSLRIFKRLLPSWLLRRILISIL